KIFSSCLDHFKDDSESNISLLKIIISELPRLEKTHNKLISQFFAKTSMVLFPFHNSTDSFDVFYNAHSYSTVIFKESKFWLTYYTIKDHIKRRIFNFSDKIPGVNLIIPYPGLLTYENEYSFWGELLYKPKNNIFTKLDTLELYKHW